MSESNAENIKDHMEGQSDDAEWENVSDGDFEKDGEDLMDDLPPLPPDGVSASTWHKQVIAAIEAASSGDLDSLLENAITERHAILNYAEMIVEAVGKAVSGPGQLTPDFASSLEMLMFLVVEHGSAAELMIFFVNVFHKEEVNAAEVEFLLPNMQGAIMRLQRFRLYWLSSILAQLDYYAANAGLSDGGGLGERRGNYQRKLEGFICDEKIIFDHIVS